MAKLNKSIWREPDPIAVVMSEKGMTRLQVLEGIKSAMLLRHSDELANNPKAPRALANLDAAILIARKAEGGK